jgi:hypothetical protein
MYIYGFPSWLCNTRVRLCIVTEREIVCACVCGDVSRRYMAAYIHKCNNTTIFSQGKMRVEVPKEVLNLKEFRYVCMYVCMHACMCMPKRCCSQEVCARVRLRCVCMYRYV